MSTFAYKALDPTGSTVQGEIEAEDKMAVASQLRSRGLIVVDIDEQNVGGGDLLVAERVRPCGALRLHCDAVPRLLGRLLEGLGSHIRVRDARRA